MITSDPTLMALHGLRLKGLAEASAVAETIGVEEAELVPRLEELRRRGLVSRRDGERTLWSLTPDGRVENERLLSDELARVDGEAAVEAAYREFLDLNVRMLDVCARWQVKDPETQTLNDHNDRSYDEAVIAELAAVDDEVQPITARLAQLLGRFARYGTLLARALANVRSGDRQWFAKPTIASYHTVWFELHEDLLATLGLDRASEARARL